MRSTECNIFAKKHKMQASARNEHQKKGNESKNTTKQIAFPKIRSKLSRNHKKKQIVRAERQLKRGCGTEKNLQKANYAKVNGFAAKLNEVTCKNIAKNKASKQLHIQSQNAKKKSTKHTHNCAQCISKMDTKCEYVTS